VSPLVIAAAKSRDISSLVLLEKSVFSGDRLSARSFHGLLAKKSARILVARNSQTPSSGRKPGPSHQGRGLAGEDPSLGEMGLGFRRDDGIVGYVLILFRKATSVARLYSIAVAPEARGQGVAKALVAAAEDLARQRGELFMRLEVRADNEAAKALYERLGYRQFGRNLDYYEDHAEALRYEKSLVTAPPRTRRAVPYYHQTTTFTCGPAALMMSLAALGSNEPLSRELEFQLWREATSIYLISAPGGCDPIGMAVTAGRRGFRAEVHVNQPGPYFVQVRQGAQRRDVMEEAQRIFARQARDLNIPIRHKPLDLERLLAALDHGAVAIVLISTHRMYGDRTPHWIVAYEHDSDYIFAHDPWVGRDELEMPAQKAGIAIPLADFEHMTIWGRSRLQAAILLEKPDAS
jgi:ribosomal protein S18 acetylase RimI-like enzyme